ncbi:sugar ABC transporter substrate-binding protein [Paenibacillus apiarius]|uniref:Sugar ABC transporter substrate-binding protein n=1 Tax=Paenibacillus apiarius TaxID=46240 RepID=A0ABT4DQU4_9BACL|nr:sugar ABC transporter substrate-binding protein [Paenibacillus apiarius]MBN3522509.1 sugar ABC transporter substrate-binding protein [Paenibacillus apiarius]MCY9514638.1 sugar ABC transporter substrate-binding protein [Paenibacillus apiarius]MCY9518628.1 sugar ABC transporter substrate-binding protein [Paenibacillus apiarius]MCY9552716.1 sugar ABC transporter substrate-binding protein [Paenibacillus apiarius]MCY9556956.1 sugar ABC transporter substrate-binding protein [Paenibacillus apiariu
MKFKVFTRFVVTLMAVMLIAAGCSTGGESSQSKPNVDKSKIENLPQPIASKDVKVMVIRKIGGDDHTAQYLAGAKQEGEAMGFTVDTFSANGDTAKFHDAIAQALEKNYDGVIISHGDDAATLDDVKKLTDKGIPVVTFDSNPDLASISGVTLTSQDDAQLAQLALESMNQQLNGSGNIVYLWVDGFPPMVSRNGVYQDFLKTNTGIKEVERFGVAASDTSVQTQNAVSAMLTKHGKGEIDAIFATWDAFAIGAARAVKEAGRDEIKIYGIDVSNADLQLMQEEQSPWVATAAVDPKVIGAVNMRLVAKKIAGEETPQKFDLKPTMITQVQLNSAGDKVNMESLNTLIPGWGVSKDFDESWMQALKEAYSSK